MREGEREEIMRNELMLMYGRKKNKLLNEWMKEKVCEVTTV